MSIALQNKVRLMEERIKLLEAAVAGMQQAVKQTDVPKRRYRRKTNEVGSGIQAHS